MSEVKHNVKTFFGDVSGEYYSEYEKNTPDGHSFRVRADRILEMVPSVKGGAVLDVGCGPGIIFKSLKKKGYDTVHGIDVSPEMVAACKERYKSDPDIHIFVGDVENIDVPNNTYDLIIAMGLVEYLEEDSKALSEISRILKPGGVALITYPNIWSPWRLWNRVLKPAFSLVRIIRRKKGKPFVHKEYTVREVKKLVEAEGLTLKRSVYYNFKVILVPLDHIFSRFTTFTSRRLEWLRYTWLKWFATGFIVEVIKK